jgi:uncharacterized membrane protein YcjF (UPF0283 family)
MREILLNVLIKLKASWDGLHFVLSTRKCYLERLSSFAGAYLIHALVEVLVKFWQVHLTNEDRHQMTDKSRVIIHRSAFKKSQKRVCHFMVLLLNCDVKRCILDGIDQEGYHKTFFFDH